MACSGVTPLPLIGCCGNETDDVATVSVLGCFEPGLADCFDDAQCDGGPPPTFRYLSDRLTPGLQQLLDVCLATPFPAPGIGTRLYETGGTFTAVICPFASTIVSVAGAFCGYDTLNHSNFGGNAIVGFAYKTKYFRVVSERYCHRDSTVTTPVSGVGLVETGVITTIFPAAFTFEVLPELPPLIVPCDGTPAPPLGPFIKACRARTIFLRAVAVESAPSGVCVFP